MVESDILALPVTDEVVEKTMINTAKKFSYTYQTLMYSRTPIELLDNIYMGDVAKNALVAYLRAHSTLPIIDYDEIRTDGFQTHDPGWDFMIGESGIKVEVKSSIPPNRESGASLINLRDIKITASHDKGKTWMPPEEIESDVHVQVYFYATPYREGYDSFDKLASDLEKDYRIIGRLINASKYNHPLFLGWTTKKRIIRHLNTLPQEQRTWTFAWTSRIYWKSPIKDALNMPQLLKCMEILKKREGASE